MEKKLKKILTSQGFVCIKLQPMKTQHFEIQAIINGVKGRFILDTGASNTCISAEKSSEFLLKISKKKMKASGAGSSALEAMISKGNTVEIGNWKNEKINIVLLDFQHINNALTEHQIPPIDGIIGADILKKGKAVIDYSKKELFLQNVRAYCNTPLP